MTVMKARAGARPGGTTRHDLGAFGMNMDTVRVNICYRPLRICWAIAANDHAAFRTAVALSNTMWGGRYNPIVIADRADEAASIVEVFRADIVVPVGTSQNLTAFQQRFAH